MDIRYKRNDFQFYLRASAIIYNEDKTKILMCKVKGRDFYSLIGGKVNELEESKNAIKRELKEEICFESLDFQFKAISEEMVNDKGYNNHQINIIFETVYNKEIKQNKFHGLEGEWIEFEWLDIKSLDSFDIYPENIVNLINNNSNHIIDNRLK